MIHASPLLDGEIPDLSLPELILDAASRQSEFVAFDDGSRGRSRTSCAWVHLRRSGAKPYLLAREIPPSPGEPKATSRLLCSPRRWRRGC